VRPTEAAGHGSVAKLHIEDIPALAAGGLNDCRGGMLIDNSRDAIPIDLPMTGRGAVGRQELCLRLRSIVAVDDVILGVTDRRSNMFRAPVAIASARNVLFMVRSVPRAPVGIADATENEGKGAAPR
jgi:hypothetical protein